MDQVPIVDLLPVVVPWGVVDPDDVAGEPHHHLVVEVEGLDPVNPFDIGLRPGQDLGYPLGNVVLFSNDEMHPFTASSGYDISIYRRSLTSSVEGRDNVSAIQIYILGSILSGGSASHRGTPTGRLLRDDGLNV